MGIIDEIQDVVSAGGEERDSPDIVADDVERLLDDYHVRLENLDYTRDELVRHFSELADQHSELVAPVARQVAEVKARSIRQRGENDANGDDTGRTTEEIVEEYGNSSRLIELAERIDSTIRDTLEHSEFDADSQWNMLKTSQELEDQYPALMTMWTEAVLVRSELDEADGH